MKVSSILEENEERFSLFPIKKKKVWKKCVKIRNSHWTAQEVDLSGDLNDWKNKLTNNERFFIGRVLGFFNVGDGLVNENLALHFQTQVQLPEARYFYAQQNAQEAIHAEMYGLQIETYISNPVERAQLFNAIQTIPCVAKKANWALRWINDKKATFGQRLVAFAVVEGIFFSGSFCAIYWLKKRNLMRDGLCKANEFIARDEALHCEFACLLFSMLLPEERPSQEVVYAIFAEAVAIEKEFVSDALQVSLIGMNAQAMCEYIECVANYWLARLGFPEKMFPAARNPFPWMELLNLEGKNNFFEGRTTEYANAARGGPKTFSTNEDF